MSDFIGYVTNQYGLTLSEELKEADNQENLKATRIIREHLPNVDITRVCVVNNPFLKGMYELKKEEYQSRYESVNEMIMIHATSECNVANIIKNNLDWRKVSRSKYGMGVSFSDDADYANYYSNRRNGTKRAFIISKILKHSSCTGSENLKLPHGDTDTAISHNGKVYVKFNDNEFLPLYAVFYEHPGSITSKYYRNRRGGFWF